MTVYLRAHHLLCILTYIGKGYSPAFTNNMTVIAGRISTGEMIQIVEGPDDICAPRRAENDAHCRDDSIHHRDRQAAKDVGQILTLQIGPGTKLCLDTYALKRLRAAFTQHQIRSACISCQWENLCTSIATNGYSGAVV